MIGLIRFALEKPRAITVAMLAILLIGILSLTQIPVDILPVYDRPAVQVLTFYSGMPPESVANAITNRMERWTGTADGMRKQESHSIMGVSVVRNYFRSGTDPNGALTQTNSLALAEVPNLPPGTLPPIVLPYDPTGTVPACLVALNSDSQSVSTLYDVGRYEVRNMIMSSEGAEAMVVFGGKIRAVLAYVDRTKLQARGLSPLDVMHAIEQYNVFLPTGDAKFGNIDFAIDSNSMFSAVDRMREIPLRRADGSADFLGDVAEPEDTSLIQMNAVRVNGKPQVYIPVYRQHGASTLKVVDELRDKIPSMPSKLTRPDIHLKLVMDQSVYVRQSIHSLATEGVLGAVLCSVVILVFLGQWKMTVMAMMTIPIAVLSAVVCLYATGNTINVMTLSGIALSIGPLVDSAIICLENTHRHLESGDSPTRAALLGASEVAMPELVASCSTLLVLAPLALMPSSGQFLFKPMALAVGFSMFSAYLLSRTFIPTRCAAWLQTPKKKKRRKGENGGGEHNQDSKQDDEKANRGDKDPQPEDKNATSKHRNGENDAQNDEEEAKHGGDASNAGDENGKQKDENAKEGVEDSTRQNQASGGDDKADDGRHEGGREGATADRGDKSGDTNHSDSHKDRKGDDAESKHDGGKGNGSGEKNHEKRHGKKRKHGKKRSRRPGRLQRMYSRVTKVFAPVEHAFDRWQEMLENATHSYRRQLDRVVAHPVIVLSVPVILLLLLILGLGPFVRRDFFPKVDAGAFQVYVRAETGMRLEATEAQIATVEEFFKKEIGDDLDLIISNIGVEADWSAAYTPNSGPMDAVVKVQLKKERQRTAQEYAAKLRKGVHQDKRFTGLEFAFDTGGMVTTALNEGKPTPINIQIKGKHAKKMHEVAENIRRELEKVDGIVDCRVMQRLDYPEYVVEIDRAKSRELGLTQEEIMKNVISAIKSSIQFNKKNFWIDPVSQNQYFVGVQYKEASIESLKTLLNVPVTSAYQTQSIPLSNVATLKPKTIAAEVDHADLQNTIDVTMGVEGRDLGHVADDIAQKLNQFGKPEKSDEWAPYDPSDSSKKKTLEGGKLTMTGEYGRMLDTFRDLGIGLVLSFTLIYFLMVSLLDSYIVPLVILAAVPVSLVGIIPMLFLTGTAINVQSLLGVIFVVGIVVSNTVLLTDVAQRFREDEGASPTDAILRAAELRAKPVVMTALAAFFSLIPMSLALEQGSEANAPLGRAVIGGLLAGLITTLVIVPALYSVAVRGKPAQKPDPKELTVGDQ